MSHVELKGVAKAMRVDPNQLKAELVRQLVWMSVFGPTAPGTVSAELNTRSVER